MKLIIGLALLSVAFATPAIQPIRLPEAPLPAVETAEELKSIELPSPNLPAFSVEGIRMLPAFIPLEVSKSLNDLGEIRADAVQVVDIANNAEEAAPIIEPVLADITAPVEVSQVMVVEYAEDAAPLEYSDVDNVEDSVAPVEGSQVNVVDNIDDVIALVEISPENAEEAIAPVEGSPVNFVDNVDDVIAPIEGSQVIVVDNIDEIIAPVEGSPVTVVDYAEAPEDVPVGTVLVVNGPIEAVDAPVAEESDLEQLLARILSAFNFRPADNDMAPPNYPPRYPNPMWR